MFKLFYEKLAQTKVKCLLHRLLLSCYFFISSNQNSSSLLFSFLFCVCVCECVNCCLISHWLFTTSRDLPITWAAISRHFLVGAHQFSSHKNITTYFHKVKQVFAAVAFRIIILLKTLTIIKIRHLAKKFKLIQFIT